MVTAALEKRSQDEFLHVFAHTSSKIIRDTQKQSYTHASPINQPKKGWKPKAGAPPPMGDTAQKGDMAQKGEKG